MRIAPPLLCASGVLGGLLSIGAGCTRFDDAPSTDGGASEGSGSEPDAGAAQDGAPFDALLDGGSFGDSSVVYSQSFPTGGSSDWGAGWTPQHSSSGALQVIGGSTCHGTFCLFVRSTGTNDLQYLTRDLPSVPPIVTASVWMYMPGTQGGGEVDFFGIKSKTTPEGAWVAWSSTAFVVEAPNPDSSRSTKPLGVDFRQWTKVSLRLDRTIPALTYAINDVPAPPHKLPDTFKAGDFVVEVGVRYAQNNKQWEVYYDDIAITIP